MKRTLGTFGTVGALFVFVAAASADDYVNGYFRKDGTYVEPYYRSTPNGNPYDNYSTRGNVNPYTGQPGTREPYERSQQTSPYSSSTFGTPPAQNEPY